MASPAKVVKAFPSRVSSTSSDSEPPPAIHLVITHKALNKKLGVPVRESFAQLLVTILKLDFEKEDDEAFGKFTENATKLTLKHVDLPKQEEDELLEKIDEDHGDLTEFIITIKTDQFVKENGTITLLGSYLLTVLEDGNYDSRYRVLLRHSAALLGILWDNFEEMEDTLTYCLMNQTYEESQAAKAMREKNTKFKKIKRYTMIGVAGGVGGVLIGLTGGLAAPFVAGAIGSVFAGSAVVAGLSTTAGAAIFGSVFGAAGAGLAGYKMKKRVGAIDEFAVETLTDGSSLHCVLCVSGWIDEEDGENAFKNQWRHLMMSKEMYTLRYESKYLIELGKAIDYLMSFAISYAIQHTLMETALAGIMTAIAWPLVLVSSASVIDNPWNVCITRAAEVGEQLADVLLTRAHGKRPITLLGFSLGARVIYHCLLAMSKRDDAQGIIEDVVLLGAPVSASPKEWKTICTVVGGRIINGYCTTDWLLRFLYRTMSVQFTIAGTGPVSNKNEKKIVNFNLSHIVKGHTDYSKKLTEVLEAVGIKVSEYSKESKENLEEFFAERDKAGHEENEVAKQMVVCSLDENGREVAKDLEGHVIFRQGSEHELSPQSS